MAQAKSVILDTNIVIELYKGNENLRSECEIIGEKHLYISEITVAEFHFGALNKKDFRFIPELKLI